MKYSVIHSNDQYLLARMATDLQMEGYSFMDMFGDSPFNQDTEWLMINRPDWCGKVFDYFCIPGGQFDPTRHELTESNYLQVLEAVLS